MNGETVQAVAYSYGSNGGYTIKKDAVRQISQPIGV
jgi:hypothetical protein